MLLCLSSCLFLLLPHSTFRPPFLTCISFYRLSCDTWDRNSTIMELNRGVLWLHCCWRWCCLCGESHNAHVVAQVKRVSRAHLLISGRQNVAYFSVHMCVIKCLIWWLVALTIYSCSCCPSDTHTYTHSYIDTYTLTLSHQIAPACLPFFIACLLRGSLKSFPNAFAKLCYSH